MKTIRMITRNVSMDLQPSLLTSKQTIIDSCKKYCSQGAPNISLAALDATVVGRGTTTVSISLHGLEYSCQLDEPTGIYIPDANGILQKIDDSVNYYDQIKALEQIILAALNPAI